MADTQKALLNFYVNLFGSKLEDIYSLNLAQRQQAIEEERVLDYDYYCSALGGLIRGCAGRVGNELIIKVLLASKLDLTITNSRKIIEAATGKKIGNNVVAAVATPGRTNKERSKLKINSEEAQKLINRLRSVYYEYLTIAEEVKQRVKDKYKDEHLALKKRRFDLVS